jgi:adenine/guanine phosphoribosyltransferase-like PRPP-binding protein
LTEEIDKACAALERWFMSQGLIPKDAAPIMVRLMARELVRKDRDTTALVAGITHMANLLGAEVAEALNKTIG